MPSQAKIIRNVNLYLHQKDALFKLNEQGVCAGLSAMYVRYSLQNRAKEFFKITRKLAHSFEEEIFQDEEMTSFLRDIEIYFNRLTYKGDHSQAELTDSVSINGHAIKKEYALGLIDSKENWAKTLGALYHEGRSCIVQSHNHAVALEFKDKQYIIYNPNYDLDAHADENDDVVNSRSFLDPREAVEELSTQFFYDTNDQTAFSLIVYAHPKAQTPVDYPDKNSLLENAYQREADFQKQLTSNQGAKSCGSAFSYAIDIDDRESIEYFFKYYKGAINDVAIIKMLITDSYNDLVIKHLNGQPLEVLHKCLKIALLSGNADIISQLIAGNELPANWIANDDNLISACAFKVKAKVLQQLFDYYERHQINLPDYQSQTFKDLLKHISENGNIDSLKAFERKYPLPPVYLVIDAIKCAAKADNRAALRYWLQLWASHPRKPETANPVLNESDLLDAIILINFNALVDSGFKVANHQLKELLKRRDSGFIEKIAASSFPVLSQFIAGIHAGILSQNLPLFDKIEGPLMILELLIHYKQNDLIQRNWTDEIDQVQGEQALQFACECGNSELVEFLTLKGYQLDPHFQANALKQAMGNQQKIKALLTAKAHNSVLFEKAQLPLIKKCIQAGHYQFILSNWQHLSKNQKIILINFAMSFANPLPDRLEDRQVYELFQDAIESYQEKLFSRTTKDDPLADKPFRHEARKVISKPVALLKKAIKFHYFHFAENLKYHISLSNEETLALFIDAYYSHNKETMTFLLSHFRSLLNNKDIYFMLEKAGHYDLLAYFLAQQAALDKATQLTLLAHAVFRHDEKTIQALSSVVNDAYKAEGSALYKAITEKNKTGALLLLKNGAELKDSDIFLNRALFNWAIGEESVELLKTILQQPAFIDFCQAHVREQGIGPVLQNGKTNPLIFLSHILPMDEYADACLEHALKTDDLILFQNLIKLPKIKSINRQLLFDNACQSRSLKIVNQLLAEPLNYEDKFKLENNFDNLFWGEDKSDIENKTAHDIYEQVYQQNLYHLYEFVKANKYRPFAALHTNIYSMIFDTGLKAERTRGLRKTLIERALDEGDAQHLAALMQQLDHRPEINQEGIQLFKEHLNNPLILGVLLEHYDFNEIIRTAIAHREWPIIIVLLEERHIEDLAPDTLVRLQEESTSMLHALAERVRRHIADDPRHKLNQLLISTSKLALSEVFKNQHQAIERLITDIQNEMIADHIDLKQHFYEFELYHQILQDHVNSAVDEFMEEYGQKDRLAILEDASARDKLLELEAAIKEKGVDAASINVQVIIRLIDMMRTPQEQYPGSADSTLQPKKTAIAKKDNQEKILRDIDAFMEANRHMPIQEILKEADIADSSINELERRVRDENLPLYLIENQTFVNLLNHLRGAAVNDDSPGPILRSVHPKRTAEKVIKSSGDASIKMPAGEAAKKVTFIPAAKTDAVETGIPDHSNPLPGIKLPKTPVIKKPTPPEMPVNTVLSDLGKLLNRYVIHRNSKGWTYHFLPFFQYNKTEKIKAALHFEQAISEQNTLINSEDRNILNDGQLAACLNKFISQNQTRLQDVLETEQGIDSINQLVQVINQKNMKSAFIKLLKGYRSNREKQSDTYHSKLFKQYNKKDKLDAVEKLLSLIEHQRTETFDDETLKIIKQGSLGNLIQTFIKEHSSHFTQHLNREEAVKNIEDIIDGYQRQNSTTLSI